MGMSLRRRRAARRLKPFCLGAAELVLGRGLACGATDSGGLRQQALARDGVAAVRADSIAPVGHALLCLLDVEQPGPINLDLGEANVAEAFGFGFVGVALDLMILRLKTGLDIGGSAADFIELCASWPAADRPACCGRHQSNVSWGLTRSWEEWRGSSLPDG